jgi:hypothetical protein
MSIVNTVGCGASFGSGLWTCVLRVVQTKKNLFSIVSQSVFTVAGLVRRGGRAREEQGEASGVRADGEDLPLLGQSHVSLQASGPLVWQTG